MIYFRNLIILSLLINVFACKTNKDMHTHYEESEISPKPVGHMKIELIDYKLIDSSQINAISASLFVEIMSPTYKSQVVFDDLRYADLVFNELDSSLFRRTLYNRSSNILCEFLRKDSLIYCAIDSLNGMKDTIEFSKEDSVSLRNIFKTKNIEETGKTLFGFKCKELMIMEPSNQDKPYMIVYLSEEIPYATQALGPLSKLLNGMPLLSKIYFRGLELTVGVVEYDQNPSKEILQHLEFDATKCIYISNEKLEEIRREALEQFGLE